uniref:Uncharacterized protein n=1 Tax=Rhipicephalus zambeziensis TaxID=60191 RepID=A0A224YGW0_9ACAR
MQFGVQSTDGKATQTSKKGLCTEAEGPPMFALGAQVRLVFLSEQVTEVRLASRQADAIQLRNSIGVSRRHDGGVDQCLAVQRSSSHWSTMAMNSAVPEHPSKPGSPSSIAKGLEDSGTCCLSFPCSAVKVS